MYLYLYLYLYLLGIGSACVRDTRDAESDSTEKTRSVLRRVQAAVSDAGGLPLIVRALRETFAPPNSRFLQAATTSLIQHLCAFCPKACRALAGAGCIAPLIELLASDAREVQSTAAGALCNLCADDTTAVMIVEAGGISHLEALLRSPKATAKTIANAALALRNLRVAVKSLGASGVGKQVGAPYDAGGSACDKLGARSAEPIPSESERDVDATPLAAHVAAGGRHIGHDGVAKGDRDEEDRGSSGGGKYPLSLKSAARAAHTVTADDDMVVGEAGASESGHPATNVQRVHETESTSLCEVTAAGAPYASDVGLALGMSLMNGADRAGAVNDTCARVPVTCMPPEDGAVPASGPSIAAPVASGDDGSSAEVIYGAVNATVVPPGAVILLVDVNIGCLAPANSIVPAVYASAPRAYAVGNEVHSTQPFASDAIGGVLAGIAGGSGSKKKAAASACHRRMMQLRQIRRPRAVVLVPTAASIPRLILHRVWLLQQLPSTASGAGPAQA